MDGRVVITAMIGPWRRNPSSLCPSRSLRATAGQVSVEPTPKRARLKGRRMVSTDFLSHYAHNGGVVAGGGSEDEAVQDRLLEAHPR
jgi:hypothetical protein